MLQNSLSNNAKTLMICNVSPMAAQLKGNGTMQRPVQAYFCAGWCPRVFLGHESPCRRPDKSTSIIWTLPDLFPPPPPSAESINTLTFASRVGKCTTLTASK